MHSTNQYFLIHQCISVSTPFISFYLLVDVLCSTIRFLIQTKAFTTSEKMSAFTSDVNCSKVQGSELGQDYCIFSSPLHADGVRAERPYIKDQVVYLETPAHFLQTIPNRQLALVCGNCARFVGSVGLQMKFLQKEVSRADLTNDPKTDFDGLQPLSSLVPCSGKCGEFYCSEECRVKHWCSKGHSLLCTGHIKDEEAEEHPLFLFKMHAVSTNEIFLMVGEIFAEIISYCEKQKEKEGKSIDVASKEIMARYSSFVRKRWWDAVQAPKGQKPIKFKKTLQNLVTETWDLLESALSLKEKGYDQILTADFVARTIGMFEQNNVGVRLANPTLEYLKNIDENTDFENIKAEIQKVADNMGEEGKINEIIMY